MAKELEDHERAHSGKPGMKVRHGADAIGLVPITGQAKRDILARAPANVKEMAKISVKYSPEHDPKD